MNKPLNIAHRREREAEQELKNHNFDEAELKYKLAADMMEKALAEASGSSLVAPLTVQLEKLREMKTVIDIKRKEATHKNQSSQESNPQSMRNEYASLPLTWQVVPTELMRMVNDKETDSLLQFMYTPVEEDDLSTSTSRKVPKSKEEIIEQYKTRLTLLRKTAELLIKALDEKEKETEVLHHQLSELQQENAELHEQLDIYEHDQCFRGIDSSERGNDEEQKLSRDMMASMLIDQPESYFEFNAKDIESELQDAVRDITPPPLANGETSNKKYHHKAKSDSRGSVQYEDLDVGSNTEVSDTILNADSHELRPTKPRMASLAGLPPSSPV